MREFEKHFDAPQYITSLEIAYKGKPELTVYLDGESVEMNQLGDHTVPLPLQYEYHSRKIYPMKAIPVKDIRLVPAGGTIGEISVNTVPANEYPFPRIWHALHVVYRGTVVVHVQVDGSDVVNEFTLTAGDQDQAMSKEIVLPSSTIGMFPYLYVWPSAYAGEVISVEPIFTDLNKSSHVQRFDQLQILNRLRLVYIGQPRIECKVDGQLVEFENINNVQPQLPNQETLAERAISLPVLTVGRVVEFSSRFGWFADVQVEALDPARFQQEWLWHYMEVTFRGTLNASVHLDGVELITETLSTSATQETRRLYFPFLSFGKVPQITHLMADEGQILASHPVAIEIGEHRQLIRVSRLEVTYEGQVDFEYAVDGQVVLQQSLITPKLATNWLWLPAGSDGRIHQWRQSGGNGRIHSVMANERVLVNRKGMVAQPAV